MRSLYRSILLAFMALFLSCSVNVALPQTAEDISDDATSEYYPSDFERFAPQSALSLISRVPGFSIRDLDTSRRGISGATGNVLINGRPVTSKSGSIFSRLAEIPIDRVEKIITYRASGGLTGRVGELVADVIVTRSTKLSGLADGSVSVSADGAASGSYGLSTQLAPNDKLNMSFTVNQSHSSSRSLTNSETIDEFGMQLSQERGRGRSAFTSARAELGYNIRPELLLNVSGFWDRSRFRDDTIVEMDLDPTTLSSTGRSQNWEVNGALAYGPAEQPTYKLTVLAKQSDSNGEAFFGAEDGEAATEFGNADRTEEIVVLLQNNTEILNKNLSVDLEWAQTRFLSTTQLGDDVLGIEGDSSFEEDVSARESRFTGQARVNLYSKNKMSLDVGLGGEYSQIFSAGERQRTLGFVTPYVGYQYTNDKIGEFSFSAERTVNQLDLTSFATSIDLIRGLVDNGNADINPERLWTLTSIYRNTFKETGSFDLSYTEEFIDGVIEFIFFENGEEGFGNAGRGRRRTLSSSLVYPFNKGTLKDTTVSLSGQYTQATFLNSFTGERQPLSSTPRFNAGASVDKQINPSLNVFASLDWSEGTSMQRNLDLQEFRSTIMWSLGLQWSFAEYYQFSVSASGSILGADQEIFTDFDPFGAIDLVQRRNTQVPENVFVSISRAF